MGKNPVLPLYVLDWMRDLEEHSLEIEGAWIRICCRLHHAEPKGKLTKTLGQWAKILRVSKRKTMSILQYIKDEKIGEITGNLTEPNDSLTVACRRMVKEAKEKELNRLRQQRYYYKAKPNGKPNGIPNAPSSSSSSSSSSRKDIKTRVTSVTLEPAINLIFKYHQEKIGNCKQLTPARKAKIKARLNDKFSADDLCLIIDYTAQDAFWIGDNDRGRAFNQIETIFRSTEKTEKNLNDARKWDSGGRIKKSNIKGIDGLRDFHQSTDDQGVPF